MSRTEDAALSSTGAAIQVLRREYLDLLMLAGRLHRGTDGPRDPLGQDAAAVRSWAMSRLKDARQALQIRHFASAPGAVIEAEIAIVAFLDSAANRLFGIRVWRWLREDPYLQYLDYISSERRTAGAVGSAVVDLGKHVYDRFEALRTHPDRLRAEPLELLEVYDRCLRLGYDATYSEPSRLEDFANKLRDELRARAQGTRGEAKAPAGTPAGELALSPDLPPIEPPRSRLPPLNPASILGLGGLLILLTGIALFILVRREEHALRQRVEDVTTQIWARARQAPERVCDRPEATTGSPPVAQRSVEEGLR